MSPFFSLVNSPKNPYLHRMEKTAYILTFGCQMNEYDSELLESILSAEGYLLVPEPNQADLIVVNTCSVRQKAEDRALARITEMTALKKLNRSLKIVVAGCMARRAGQSIIDQIPLVDYVVGPDHVPEIAEIIEQNSPQKIFISDTPDSETKLSTPKTSGPAAFLAISRGCENYCSYCIVPYVRGAFRSRPAKSIIKQVAALTESGIKDITLLGQNVNSYQDNDIDFSSLLKAIAPIGPPRLRFLTSHPKDLSDRLIETMAEIPAVCHSLHLPLQAGSDKILKAMNRGYAFGHYLTIVEKLRRAMPDITLTTDLIVGFPGETDDDFEQTLEAVKAIEYDAAFMFRYSVRPGTAAAEIADDVPEPIKIERLTQLILVQQQITEQRNSRWVGKKLEILIDGFSRRQPIMPKGKTRGGISVLIGNRPNLKIGDMIAATVVSSRAKTLFADFENFA
jgi:tRNA-2-methylthio-N6-dimethylallyladenosine synthase